MNRQMRLDLNARQARLSDALAAEVLTEVTKTLAVLCIALLGSWVGSYFYHTQLTVDANEGEDGSPNAPDR